MSSALQCRMRKSLTREIALQCISAPAYTDCAMFLSSSSTTATIRLSNSPPLIPLRHGRYAYLSPKTFEPNPTPLSSPYHQHQGGPESRIHPGPQLPFPTAVRHQRHWIHRPALSLSPPKLLGRLSVHHQLLSSTTLHPVHPALLLSIFDNPIAGAGRPLDDPSRRLFFFPPSYFNA